MGNTQATHIVFVKTGTKKGAGVDADIYIQLGDETGNWSTEQHLDVLLKNDFEAGVTDTFSLNLPELKRITELSIRRDETGADDSWFVEKVAVKDLKTQKLTVFPVTRFIHANDHIRLSEYDSSLPSEDKYPEQRHQELQKKQQLYQLIHHVEGLPASVKTLPEDEDFNFSYQVFIGGTLVQLGVETELLDFFTGEFKSLEDFEKVYRGAKVQRPLGIYRWQDDAEFGNQRIAGVNPNQMVLCEAIPSKFAVTAQMVEPFLEGMTLEQALASKRLYLIDYSFLDNLECTDGRQICAPYALFYSHSNKDLMPIAIQLMPTPSSDNPVFTPSDPKYTWLLAKIWFNLADASVHQSATHLGLTHLLMESVAVTANRQLSPSHPIYRLLAPHFLYILAINTAALSQLIAPGAWVDQAMQIGEVGMKNIIKKKWKEYNLLEDAHLPNNLKKRGVDDTLALPEYPYRDDALLLWNSLAEYVDSIVNEVYDTPAKLVGDSEIQAFAAELSSPEGAGIKGIPVTFSNTKELSEVLTCFIFISSVQHAAANFGQYDEYGFSPNYPASVRSERPMSKEKTLTEDDIVKCLPDKEQMLKVILVTRLLSSKATDSLGRFETQYLADPKSLKSLEQLRYQLQEVQKTIELRNATRKRQYPYLQPEDVPNAISI